MNALGLAYPTARAVVGRHREVEDTDAHRLDEFEHERLGVVTRAGAGGVAVGQVDEQRREEVGHRDDRGRGPGQRAGAGRSNACPAGSGNQLVTIAVSGRS
ncbi:MAG: hypothetical protein ABJC79_15565 [Acidimicrobiia bacterium]